MNKNNKNFFIKKLLSFYLQVQMHINVCNYLHPFCKEFDDFHHQLSLLYTPEPYLQAKTRINDYNCLQSSTSRDKKLSLTYSLLYVSLPYLQVRIYIDNCNYSQSATARFSDFHHLRLALHTPTLFLQLINFNLQVQICSQDWLLKLKLHLKTQ